MGDRPDFLASGGDRMVGYMVVWFTNTVAERDGLVSRRKTTVWYSDPVAVLRAFAVDTWDEGTAIYRDETGQAYTTNFRNDEMVEWVVGQFTTAHSGSLGPVDHEFFATAEEALERRAQLMENDGDATVATFSVLAD